jgi:hypothetical protein
MNILWAKVHYLQQIALLIVNDFMGACNLACLKSFFGGQIQQKEVSLAVWKTSETDFFLKD